MVSSTLVPPAPHLRGGGGEAGIITRRINVKWAGRRVGGVKGMMWKSIVLMFVVSVLANLSAPVFSQEIVSGSSYNDDMMPPAGKVKAKDGGFDALVSKKVRDLQDSSSCNDCDGADKYCETTIEKKGMGCHCFPIEWYSPTCESVGFTYDNWERCGCGGQFLCERTNMSCKTCTAISSCKSGKVTCTNSSDQVCSECEDGYYLAPGPASNNQRCEKCTAISCQGSGGSPSVTLPPTSNHAVDKSSAQQYKNDYRFTLSLILLTTTLILKFMY